MSCARSSTAKLGAIRAAISYGSLYPTLRRLQAAGWITEAAETPAAAEEVPAADQPTRPGGLQNHRGGQGALRRSCSPRPGPRRTTTPGFGVHFAFFARTDQATRLRILEGRRRRIEERREGLRDVLGRAAERLDAYTLELQRHGLDACEREVRWLEELIANERSGRAPTVPNHRDEPAADEKTTARLRLERPGIERP